MNTSLEQDKERMAPEHRQQDRELTLSPTTLLVIFFGLVLICGLFFGLGYTVGRRATGDTNPTANTVAAPSSEAGSVRAKPSPGIQSGAAAGISSQQTASQVPDATEGGQTSSLKGTHFQAIPRETALGAKTAQVSTTAIAAATALPASSVPASAFPKVHPAFATESAKTSENATLFKPAAAPNVLVMVQIAAVSNQADADVLLSALRRRGYSVSLRHEPGDTLMHVQVGPFVNRADAVAMRQKLLSDGYNAILK